MNIIGVKLRQAREAAGLSMNKLAALSGVSRTYISAIEKDQANNPAAAKVLALAAALGLLSSDLVGDVPTVAADPVERKYETRVIGGRKRRVRVPA